MLSIAALLSILLAEPASAQDLVTVRGYSEFCDASPAECVRDGTRIVNLTPARAAELAAVNAAVNAEIRYVASGRWEIGGVAGDCRSYALTKRARLAALGWPRSAMSIAIIMLPWGETHAVLMVMTDR